MTKIAYFASVLFVMLVGCNNKTCASDDTECQSECPDCVVDNGKTAKVSIDLIAENSNGSPFNLDAEVQIGEVVGRTGDVLTVPAEVDLGVNFSYSNLTTHDGFGIIEYDGLQWAKKVPDPLNLNTGEDTSTEFTANVYFSGKYACEKDVYGYNKDTPDLKGEYDYTGDLSTQQIDVVGTQKIVPRSNSDWSFLEGTLFIIGRHIELRNGDYMYSTASEIMPDEWVVTIVKTDSWVIDLRCILD